MRNVREKGHGVRLERGPTDAELALVLLALQVSETRAR